MKNSEKTLDMIVNLCKNRGYVYAGSEIYGGLANSWDYGPLGVEFKNNVKKAWLKKFVQESPYNVAHGVDIDILAGLGSGDQLVSTLTGAAALAVHQGVGEGTDMAGGDPGLRVHDDGGIQTHIVGRLLDELLQPGLLNVVLELDTQRAVVPRVCQTAVDLGTCVDVAAVLAEIDDHVKRLFTVLHCISSKI